MTKLTQVQVNQVQDFIKEAISNLKKEYEERILKLENEVNILKDKINNKPSFSMALTGGKSDDLSLLISNTANKQINSRKQTEKNIVISGLAPSDNDDSKIDEILKTLDVVEPNRTFQ